MSCAPQYGRTLLHEEWVGIPAEPPQPRESRSEGAHEYVGWRWTTTSDSPCTACTYLNGKYFPSWPSKPHTACACERTPELTAMTFLGRQALGCEEWEEREPYKEIPPGGEIGWSEGHEITYSTETGVEVGVEEGGLSAALGVSFGTATTTTSEESVSIGNSGTDPAWAYHVTVHQRQYYADYWAYGPSNNRQEVVVQGYHEQVWYRILDTGSSPDDWTPSAPPDPDTYENVEDPDFPDPVGTPTGGGHSPWGINYPNPNLR